MPKLSAQANVDPQFSNISSNKIAFYSLRINNPHWKWVHNEKLEAHEEKNTKKYVDTVSEFKFIQQ